MSNAFNAWTKGRSVHPWDETECEYARETDTTEIVQVVYAHDGGILVELYSAKFLSLGRKYI